MDLTDSYVLSYGGFDDEEEIPKKDTIYNTNDITKIIKYNDYENHYIIKMNDCECAICLEEFNKEETTPNDIIKSIEEYRIKKYIQEHNSQYIDEYKINKININNTCIISCYHIFHNKCLLEWYKKNKSCPLCRKNLNKIK